MTEFWIFIAVLWVLATLIVWWHYFVGRQVAEATPQDSRQQTNVSLYKEQLAELENDLANEAIDQESFSQLKTELDKTLLQDLEADEAKQLSGKKLNLLWPVLLTVFVVGFSGAFYFYQPSFDAYQQAMLSGPAPADPHSTQDKQEIERIAQLETIVAAEPDNSRAWYTLAQSYVMVGAYEKALAAYDKVIDIEGEIADIFGSKAQTLYYKNGQQLTPEVQQMIDKALALDPLDSSTLVLLGMHHYLEQDFVNAVNYWQKVVDSNRPNVNKDALMQAIAEAQGFIDGTSAPEDESLQQAMEANIDGPKVNLQVSLSDEAISLLSEGEDKAVYVYATAAEGSRMPLAVVKLMASDLPSKVRLSNANAMSPQANLSSAERINVYAVVSMDGSVGIKPGDIIAEQLDVATEETDELILSISQRVE